MLDWVRWCDMAYDKEQLKDMYDDRFEQSIVDYFNLKLGKRKGNYNLYYCPFHGDEKTPDLSYHIDRKMWKCHACGWSRGDIYQHLQEDRNMTFKESLNFVAEELGVDIDDDYSPPTKPIITKKKKFDIPNVQLDELNQEQIEYMGLRGITKETLNEWKVKNNNGRYSFQYFENDELIHISYRGVGKGSVKGGCEPNTKHILWGFDKVDISKPLVITEGQPDAMIIYQSGYKNVVSVPSGSNNLNWIDYCWEKLNKFDEIIVWADNDKPGIKMAKTIQERLSNTKIIVSDQPDANEMHYKKGPKEVLKLIMDKITEMPDGLINLSKEDFPYYNDLKGDSIQTGFKTYDKHVHDWKPGELTLLFARNGEGKSTLISQIVAHCIQQNVKTYMYNGEMSLGKIQNWLYRQIVADTEKAYFATETKYETIYEIKPEIVEAIKKWHDGKLFVHDNKNGNNIKKILQTANLAVDRYGVKLIVIDNLMSAMEQKESINHDQSNFMQACKDFADDKKVHVVVLAHPNKNKEELGNQSHGNLTKRDVSGTGNLPNKATNIIALERVWDSEEDTDLILTSLKDRPLFHTSGGGRLEVHYKFSRNTLRFYNDITPENYNYDWKKYLSDSVYKKNYELIEVKEAYLENISSTKDDNDEKIEVKKGLENSPF